MPKVSVIIPSYNRAEYLPEAISSVLAQTYRDFEIIVVDDGSTDDTREALEPFGDRIRYFYKEHECLSSTRNFGIREARGEFIAFLDSDDLWHPEKLQIQLKYLTADKSNFVCITAFEIIDSTSPPIWSSNLPREKRLETFGLRHVFEKPFMMPSSAVIKKIVFDRVGLFDETLRIGEDDMDIYLRIARSFVISFIDLPLVKYRIHCGNMSADIRAAGCRLKVLKKFLKKEPEFAEANKAAIKKVLFEEHGGYAFRLLRIRDFGKAISHFLWSFYYGGLKKRESILFLKELLKNLPGVGYLIRLRRRRIIAARLESVICRK